MSSYPFTLKFMETVASREDREDAIRRKTSGFEYFLLLPFRARANLLDGNTRAAQAQVRGLVDDLELLLFPGHLIGDPAVLVVRHAGDDVHPAVLPEELEVCLLTDGMRRTGASGPSRLL